MSVSYLEFILSQGPITKQLACYLTLIDICRLTAVSRALRFKWPVKCNSVLNVLNKALSCLAWPCLPTLTDELKNNSCEYNVFCNMMEQRCRISNLDLTNSANLVLYCVGGCGKVTMSKHDFVGSHFTNFTICKDCFAWYHKIQGKYVFASRASMKHGPEAEANRISGCLRSVEAHCACSVWPLSFILEQVQKDVESKEKKQRKKRKRLNENKKKLYFYFFANTKK